MNKEDEEKIKNFSNFKVTLISPDREVECKFIQPSSDPTFALAYSLHYLPEKVGECNVEKYTRYRVEEKKWRTKAELEEGFKLAEEGELSKLDESRKKRIESIGEILRQLDEVEV
ncbi:MAG: hypothetical protein LBC75_01090 [Fibromonadaceae bacterium]|jgi:hypothetical protein|nr:hypothetical protein [Fibromonadaceae bacterium]